MNTAAWKSILSYFLICHIEQSLFSSMFRDYGWISHAYGYHSEQVIGMKIDTETQADGIP